MADNRITIQAEFGQSYKDLGFVGRVGENDSREIVFDCADALTQFPSASIVCVIKRACDTKPYSAPLTEDESSRILPLSAAENAAAGQIMIELRAVSDDTILKSAMFSGRIAESLQGEGDRPGNPASDMLNRIDSTLQSATETQEKLLSALDGVDTAVDGANTAAENAQTVANTVQAKLDNGDFVGPAGKDGKDGKQGPKGDTGATGPQGASGSDASVTAENIQSALGYTPGKELTSEGSTGQIENLFPDKITVVLNEFWRYGNVCQFVFQFSVSETMAVDYGVSIAKLPFASAMRCWLNNATQFYVDRDTSYIRLNDETIHSGGYILSGMYITNTK